MKPRIRIGAASPFGLALPSAQPTASQLYAPRGVWMDNDRLIVADSGNHRILIWHTMPQHDGCDADVVLGQMSFTAEGPRAAGAGAANGLHLPTGVLVHDGMLLVADAWHHRVLVWSEIPTSNSTPPTFAIGQPDLESTLPNAGGAIAGNALYWPYGIQIVNGWLWIADTGNRRVLGWPGIPTRGESAAVVLGQDGFERGDENRGGAPTSCSFRWPHAIAGDAESLYIADAGNHRVLGWSATPTEDTPASLVLGQPDFTTNTEQPHRKQGAQRMRFPYAIALQDRTLGVADTANNRVLFWHDVPSVGAGLPADEVIGQHDFDASGENRWKSVEDDTLCWPYGIATFGDRFAVADSGNNRVMLWDAALSPL
jgi:NHL repeat